jgi:hypothetical protein
VVGTSAVGSRLAFHFDRPEPAAVMAVEALVPPAHVAWRCLEGPDEWVGTTITFDLVPEGDATVVRFAHAGWAEATELMGHCSARWAYFVLSLKLLCETGKGTPFPDDLKF